MNGTTQAALLQIQEALADRVGEPVLLGIRLVYDAWFEVEIQTFTERAGLAAGRDLAATLEEAVTMLLALDEITTARPGGEGPSGHVTGER